VSPQRQNLCATVLSRVVPSRREALCHDMEFGLLQPKRPPRSSPMPHREGGLAGQIANVVKWSQVCKQASMFRLAYLDSFWHLQAAHVYIGFLWSLLKFWQ
jgi:hypothetical protein